MQTKFNTQYVMDFQNEIRVDLFAGGGGASTGTEMGTGLPVTIAINHDPDAISLHKANHPHAEHYLSDVYEVDPIEACRGRIVGHLHASPDCTHHSQASGGQPRKKAIRSLSWVVLKWIGKLKRHGQEPRLITLENVEQILDWSPLVAKRCKSTGRVIKLDKTVAAPGEIVPVGEQFLVPNKRKKGHNWEHFVQGMRDMGYAVQWRVLKACDFGAPTTRERLFLIARCDGEPITWPKPSHAQKPTAGQKPWRTAAECIDWSDLGQSIFERPRPLAEATLKRIAKGIRKFVLDAEKPFLVPGIGGFITEHANASNQRNMAASEPLRTICATVKGGHFGVATAHMLQLRNNCDARSVEEPVRTISAGGEHHGLVTAFVARNFGGFYDGAGNAIDTPLPTVTAKDHSSLVTAFISRQFGNSIGHPADQPSGTITAGGGGKSQLVALELGKEQEDKALRCAAFLLQYYSEGGQWGALDKPINTITTRERMALVTVMIRGEPWVIVDIRLRMLKPAELFLAQSFPENYIIDRGHDGRKFPATKQVRFVGNSVPPLPLAAIMAANYWPRGIANDNTMQRAAQ